MSFARLLRTVRYLKPSQVFWLAVNRARRAYDNPASVLRRPVPPFPGVQWQRRACPHQPTSFDPDDIRRGCFEFVGEAHNIDWPPKWEAPGASRLWQYNLHYMEYLWALDFDDAKSLVEDYIKHHGPARRRSGWEPYPLSLRIMEWCNYFFGDHRDETAANGPFQQRLWEELWRMGTWLERRLEWHLRANHLMENILALTTLAQCFEASDAIKTWRRNSHRKLIEQIREQILPDGGHFERSPMYHTRMLLAMSRLHARADDELQRVLDPIIAHMQTWLAAMSHPDGDIVLFNDAAFGIYPTAGSLVDLPDRVDEPMTFALRQSGYYGAHGIDGGYVAVDAAPIGPNEQPGHAHADIFTFEMSVAGHRAIVDAGTFGYVETPERSYCRSTHAHNTVSVEGRDQCEMWGAFRVGRRTVPRKVQFEDLNDGFRLSGSHDGYARLGARRHRRVFRWFHDGVLMIEDTVDGKGIDWASHVRIEPSWKLDQQGDSGIVFHRGSSTMTVAWEPGIRADIESGQYHPRFGRTVPCTVLALRPVQGGDRIRFGVGGGAIVGGRLDATGLRTGNRIYEW